MATSDDWSRVGFSGNPVTGDPGVVEGITKELRELSDLAGRVSGGLDSLLAKAEDGGFEGRTADALRTYVKEELKTFMANVNRSFDMAATATARYARALGDARDRAEEAADLVATLERVGGQPLAADDPELARARGDVDAEADAVQAEAKILEETLREASRLVSQPVKKPKQSFWKKFVSTFFKVLEIVTLVLTLVAAVVTGPLGLVAFGLGAVLFTKALVDYAMGNGNALSLGLAFLGILFPSTKGLTTVSGLTRMAASGAKALSGALSASGRLLFRAGRMLFSPRALLTLTAQGLRGLAGGLGGLGSRALTGWSALPRVFSRTPGMLASTLRYMGGFGRSTWQRSWSALSRDFYQSTAFFGGNMAMRVGIFSIMSMGRLTVSALLPMRYSEIAQLGYRGAARMGFVERGLHWSSRSMGPLARTGALGGDLANLTGRGLNPTGGLRPVGDPTTGKLATPGTPEFNATLDELTDTAVRKGTAPGTPGFSSLPGPGPVRFPGRLDELGGRPGTLETLDTVGLPVGTVPLGERLGLTPLLPPRSTVDQLRDLDTLTGLERTDAGLLKPLDDLADLADLAPLSLDGKLGGLTEVQVRQILDGEIDLVNVTPGSVVLRVGKTDPVDVRVQLKDGVTVEVLGPADPRVPTLTTTTGANRLDDLGMTLGDLARLIPDTTDGARTARELLGLRPVRTDLTPAPVRTDLTAPPVRTDLTTPPVRTDLTTPPVRTDLTTPPVRTGLTTSPVRTDLTTPPVTTKPTSPPLTLRDIVTGGATGPLATDRFQTWLRTQSAQFQLDTAGRRLSEITGLTDVPPLSRAQAELDLSGAQLGLNRARIEFDRLGMNLDTVRRDITVMTARLDEVGGGLDLGHLSDDFRLDRFDAPAPRSETVLLDPQQFAGATGIRMEWQRTPLDGGGFALTDPAGDIRLVFGADDVLRFRDLRLPVGDGFLRFDAAPQAGSLPRVVGPDGAPLSGGVVIEPVRGALKVVTGVRVEALDGAWIGRFDLDGTRLSEQVTLSGLTGSPLGGARLTTTFTQLPGGGVVPSVRLTVAGAGEGAFSVVRLEGELAQRLPGGVAVTEVATGSRSLFDRAGRFVDLPADGTTPIRLDTSGAVVPVPVPEMTTGPLGTLDDLGGLGERGLGDLGGLGELADLGALNRLTLTDLPRTNLTPEPLGLDVRLGATVTDGGPTPVNLSRFDGMSLSGADELTNLRLRVTELPATELTPASFRIDVVDFGAPGGPVRLSEVTVTVREGGGLTLTGPQGGVRWQLDALGHLEHRELPLNGTDLALRFTDDALNPMPRVVGPDGVPVPGATVTPVRDASGALSGLTVKAPAPGTDGLPAVWRFEPGGLLRQQELPLTLPGLDGPAGLGIKVTTTPGPGGTTTRVLELTGPSHLTGSFRLTSVDASLAGRLPNGSTLTDTVTGSRFHLDAGGRLALRDLPNPDGTGFLRFTEDAAPGTPPVRLDDLGGLGGLGDTGLALDDVAQIFNRTLDEAAGFRVVPDAADPPDLTGVRALDLPAADLPLSPMEGPTDLTRLGPDGQPLPLDDLNRLTGPDSPRTDSFSGLSDLSDLDLAAIGARLEEHRQVVDQLNRVPLSGVDELAGLDLRLTRLPATDTTPQGSYRLELVDRTPGGTGTVRASDYRVELLDDSGRFAVIDPNDTTRFTFSPEGRFLGRETALAFDGLPAGLRLQVRVEPGADGTGRVMVDVVGPSGATASVRLTPVSGALAGRLPGGFTLTDLVTGSRFHFDHTGRLVFRDLPDRDGSGFLRFTEGAAPGTPPVRLDELGDFGGGLRERFPLGSVPEDGVLDDMLDGVLDRIDLARVFDRTLDEASGIRALDEASGIRTLPDGAPVDLSGIAGAMDFLRVAPDSHAVQSLGLPGLQRLTDDATASLDRFGLRPELLNDQLRQLTGQARQTLRQHAVTALGDYLDLPLATRLDDLRSVGEGAGGRVLGDFTVTPTPHGGPGGSRYTVHHNPSDITLGFGPNRELRYQEVFLRGGPDDLDGLKVGITGHSADGGPWTPSSLDFVGPRPADGLFTTAPNPHGGLTLTDAPGTTSWHYGPEGVHTLTDVKLPGDRGILRFDADAPGGVPQVLDPAGHQLPGMRVELLDDGRIALVPTGKAAQPMERTVFSRTGTLLEETIAVRIKGGKAGGEYWKIDHATSTAVRVDASGTPLTGRFATAKVELSGTGRFKLTGEGNVTLFEREVLGNGNLLHIDLDRVGRARWTEFDPAGTKVRSGERIWDSDRRTVHDTLSYRWAPMDVLDVRTYTKAVDGGLIRAEKGAAGDWTWTRFDSGGAEVLSGTREWSWNHIGFKDTYLDPATGQLTVAQQRGNMWPLDGYHGSRQYLEHPVLPGEGPTGLRVNPELHSAVGPANKPIDVIEHLADGGTLHVVRLSDQRMPAALWQTRTGAGRFDGFFKNPITGDSMFTVSKWTETAADGTRLKGVRLVSHAAHSWRDIDQFGRVVRETRKLENGNVVEVGRSLDDPTQWAPAPKWNGSADSYELPWLDTKSGVFGTRHVAGDGSFEDVFTNAAGDELVSMRSQGTGVREYLGENPARGLGRDDVSGVWVDKNTQLQTTGRRDQWGDLHIEAHGDPRHRTWQWKATGPDGTVTEGIRTQNRGSLYSRTWDDSFTDFERLDNGRPGQALRERNATDDGTVWIDATRQPDTTWTWQKTNADGTVHSQGVREYQDFAKGHWTDRIGDDVVRQRTGGRVREYAYTVEQTAPPTPSQSTLTPPALTPSPETGPTTLADLLSRSARHFEPTATVTVDRQVWREFDMGKVVHRRDAVEGVPGRYRESESLWGQWREYQGDRLVAQRTITGRVWATDAFGRWSAFDIAKLPEFSSLPSVGGQVGLDGHRAWRLIGREADFRGYTTEFRGLNRESRDPFHEIWTGVQDGSSAAMPVWRHELRKAATEFATGFLIEFGTSFAVSAIVADFAGTRFDPMVAFERALLNGAVGGGIRAGFNVAQDVTALGKIKYGLTNLDQGQDFNRHPLASVDDWAGEWSSYENPSRWRSGSYAFFDGLAVSALTGFVNNALNATIWGVGGQQRTGLEALEAGAWGAAGSLFTGVTSGLGRYTLHTTAGSRIFHRGGPGELIWQSAEALSTGIVNYWLNTRGAEIVPARAFPPSTTTSTTPSTTTPSTTAPQPPAAVTAVSPIEGLELT